MQIRVKGRNPLNGLYVPHGNPNAAKASIAASMLSEHAITLQNIPTNRSTLHFLEVAKSLGATVSWQNSSTLTLQTPQLTQSGLTEAMMQGAVGSLLYIPALLARQRRVTVEIGFPLHRIRTHLNLLRDLQQQVTIHEQGFECVAQNWDAADIILDRPSVTASEIAIMLAVTLGKSTTLRHVACEPHINDLVQLLRSMGAEISGEGSNCLHIVGQPSLTPATQTLSVDHIETASMIAIGALCGGTIEITPPPHTQLPDLRVIGRTFAQVGIHFNQDAQHISVPQHARFIMADGEEDVDASIETSEWPGFPSDLVSIITLVASIAEGTTLIHERLFRDRLLFVDTLKRMGANIVLADPHRALVIGGASLYADYIPAPDPRFGLGLLGATLLAEGESVIDNAQYFNYTFANVLDKLTALGADIEVNPTA